MSGRALLVFGAVGVAFAAACSLTSLSGLSGGGANDGGRSGQGDEGGGGGDGGDGGGTGAPAPSDGGGLDAADGGPFCPGQGNVPFCADFDEGDPAKVYENGTLTLAATESDCDACVASLSPPGTLMFTIPDTPDAGGSSAHVRFDGPVTVDATASASLRFAMKIVTLSLAQQIDLASVQLGSNGSGTARVYIGVSPSGLGELFVDRPGKSNSVDFTLPADAQWHGYVVTLATSAAALTGTVSVDDGPATKNDCGGAFPAAHAWFELGPSAVTPAKPFEAVVDNAVFTAN